MPWCHKQRPEKGRKIKDEQEKEKGASFLLLDVKESKAQDFGKEKDKPFDRMQIKMTISEPCQLLSLS